MIIKPELKGNFTQINNDLINHKNLSNTAKLLAIKILSLPTNWKINTVYLANFLQLSTRSVNRYLKELVDNEIFEKVQEVEENSTKFTRNFTIIFKSETENEKETNEPLQSPKNSPIECETMENNGFASPAKTEPVEQSNSDNRDKKPLNDLVSHINNKEYPINTKNLYRMQIVKNRTIFLFFKGHKIKNCKLDFSSFTDREKEAIEEWFKYKARFKRLNIKSKEFQLKKLRSFKLGKQNIIKIIETSITNGWQGLFAFKNANKQDKRSKFASVKQAEKDEILNYFDEKVKASL